MNTQRSITGWCVASCMIVALLHPGAALADYSNDNDSGESAPARNDEDDIDEANGLPGPDFDARDENDDAFEAFDDDNDDDNDNDDDDDDDDDGFDGPRPNQAIVQLQPGVDAVVFASRHGVTVLRVIPGPNVVLLQLDPARDDIIEVQEILADGDVEQGELNFTAQAPEGRPRYFFTSVAGAPDRVSGPALPAGLEFTPAVACATGTGVVVAVLDTGIDAAHPDLAANVLPKGKNFVDDNFDVRDVGNGFDDDGDGQIDEMVGHGTHVSGAILQVAPDARILPVKVLNSDGVGDAFYVAAGMYYAVEQGADLVNLSLGSTHDSFAVRDAVDFAIEQGVVVVAAAGNGDRGDPADYPAAVEGAISVAATTALADKAEYSNFHETVDISAPGSNLASAYPGGLYTSASGTSMATSLVTGAAALIIERQPDSDSEVVNSAIEAGSGPLNLSDLDLVGLLGAGEIDIDASIACGG